RPVRVLALLLGGVAGFASCGAALAQSADFRPSTYDSETAPVRPAGTGAPIPSTGTAAPLPDAFDRDGAIPPPAASGANYGKPKPFTPKAKSNRKAVAHPLPELAPYPTSAEARRRAALGLRTETMDPALLGPAPTTAMPASIPPRPRPKVELEPFAPIGFYAGPLRAHAYSETDFGYNSNPNQASPGASNLRGSSFLREEIGVSAESDWSNHSFVADMRLGYNDYFNQSSANAPDGTGKFLARVDVARDTRINIDGNYTLSTQYQTSPNLYNNGASTQLASRPLVAVYGGGIGASQIFNRTELTLRGSFERNYWADAQFADGSTQYLSRDSYDDYGLTLRAAYELTPGVKPFVEGIVDRRIHDTTYGTSGYARDSSGVQVNAGSTFELTRLLTGSASAGYADRNYQDPRLANLRGAMFDISLIWTATPLTKVTLRTLTTMDETTVAGASGTITRGGTLEIAHALRRDLTITATGGVQYEIYPGNPLVQTYYSAGLKAEYNLTRNIVLKGAYTFQAMTSNQKNTDYTANIMTVGLRLQQ
ncbi:outer membrane beta-barrel protein, partial [Rhodoblastus sp.]|uniref:outer membrane beta-barrel protein n=1 Tax=Rhodoblastus sp. TaxID=1962975 RepID=UPI0035B0CF6C